MEADNSVSEFNGGQSSPRKADLRRICERIRPRLLGIAASQLGPAISAKIDPSDVVQNALTAVTRSLEQFQGKSTEELEAWIVQITRNEAKDALRFWHQARRDIGAEHKDAEGLVGEFGLPLDSSTPSGKLMKKEEAASILRAVDQLPADEQAVVKMRHLQGQSLVEIAEAIGRSPDGTAGLLKRAMSRLRTILSNSSDEGTDGTPSG